jgi:hypothetical protein
MQTNPENSSNLLERERVTKQLSKLFPWLQRAAYFEILTGKAVQAINYNRSRNVSLTSVKDTYYRFYT